MGKRSHRRSTRRDETNVGCVWGLTRLLNFRRDPKLLMDAKQVSERHTFREITDRGQCTKGEINKNDNIEECSLQKPTVKKLMDDELRRVHLLKNIPNAGLENDLSLDGSSQHTSKTIVALDHDTDISASYFSGSVDSEGSKGLDHSEEYDLESVLASFLGEIYRCHNGCTHDDCKTNNELCPSLKSLVHQKLNDLSNHHCNAQDEQPEESKTENLLDDNSVPCSRAAQSKELKDALEILGSNKELFLKLLQKPNAHMLDNIRKHQDSRLTTKLEPNKTLGETNFLEETRASNHHQLAAKAQGKESKRMFFWRKDKSNRKQMLPEGTNRSQPVSKIFILKPNPGRGTDQSVTSSARYLHQRPCTSQAPEYSGRESSKFSIREIMRRFRIGTVESRRERPSISSKQKQQNVSQTEIGDRIVASEGASIFYEEAKKHLTDMLKDNNESSNYPTQVSQSLEGMLSLPHRNVSSPRSHPKEKGGLDLSPEETDAGFVSMDGKEECVQERIQSWGESESSACRPSAVVDGHVAVQEECSMKAEQGPVYVTDFADSLCIDGIDIPNCVETSCNVQCIPAEQCPQPKMLEETEQGKEPVEMFLSYPESNVEKLEQQDPEAPEPRASTKLIAHASREQSHEKQEQLSPTSVLDSFFEDVADPVCEKTEQCVLHEDFHGILLFPDTQSDAKLFWEDKNVRFEFIKLALELSELCAEQNLEVWYLEDELISPCLFEELQNEDDQIDDLKLLFDCTCEAVTEIQERYFRLSSWLSFLQHDIRTPPLGENLISEVDKYVDSYLQPSLPSTSDQMVKRDLEVRTRMEVRSITEGIIVEIWEFVLDELIDEAVFDLWM